jgi:hypothetical protein
MYIPEMGSTLSFLLAQFRRGCSLQVSVNYMSHGNFKEIIIQKKNPIERDQDLNDATSV